ncbi:MAG TPA: hypothetical protein VHK90_10855 [Thermoanaerobaculia bacterium]|nr:hypothetical protein [Thermoanaerobaculia bacterium]
MDIVAALNALVQIVGYVKSAVGAWETAKSIIGELTGKQSGPQQMMAALQTIEQELGAGLAAVAEAVRDQTLQQKWQPFADQLNAIQQEIGLRMQELATLDPQALTIDAGGRTIPFAEWAAGAGGSGGALDDLGKQLESLSTLFASGGAANASAVDLWSEVSLAAIPNADPGFARQTQYTLMFAFLTEIYAILAQLYYTRENALALYNTSFAPADSPYVPLAANIEQWFGDTTKNATVWGQFDAAMTGVAAQPPGQDDLSASVTGADSGQNDPPVPVSMYATYGFIDLSVTTASQPNSCFAGLQLQMLTIPYNDYYLPVLYVQGLLVTVGPNATFTTGTWVTGFDQANPRANTVWLGPQDCRYIDLGYVAAPPVPNGNVSNVITGFRVAHLPTNNRYGIALQFGQLDLSNPAAPSIKVVDPSFHFSSGGGYLTLVPKGDENPTMNVDVRPAATASLLPASNAAFALLPGTQNSLGVRVQTAWTGYRATMFQPSQTLNAAPPKPSA